MTSLTGPPVNWISSRAVLQMPELSTCPINTLTPLSQYRFHNGLILFVYTSRSYEQEVYTIPEVFRDRKIGTVGRIESLDLGLSIFKEQTG